MVLFLEGGGEAGFQVVDVFKADRHTHEIARNTAGLCEFQLVIVRQNRVWANERVVGAEAGPFVDADGIEKAWRTDGRVLEDHRTEAAVAAAVAPAAVAAAGRAGG